MNQEPFRRLTALCMPLNRNNVDTDQVIPARFLKGTAKTGLGKNLFNDWRYLENGQPNPDFVLNRPQHAGARILVAAHNFGCGSSREHAPWALKDYGFLVILAVSFADIFRNNALKNGLLPVELPETVILEMLERIEQTPNLQVTVDLEAQTVELPEMGTFNFHIDAFRRQCLLEGLDEITYSLKHLPAIEAYEQARDRTGLAC